MCGAVGAWVQPALCQPCPHPCAICLTRAWPGSPAKALPGKSVREDAPCPVLRWNPDHVLSSKTLLQLGQSQAGLWVHLPVLPSLFLRGWGGGERWLMPLGHVL